MLARPRSRHVGGRPNLTGSMSTPMTSGATCSATSAVIAQDRNRNRECAFQPQIRQQKPRLLASEARPSGVRPACRSRGYRPRLSVKARRPVGVRSRPLNRSSWGPPRRGGRLARLAVCARSVTARQICQRVLTA
jgi:hypothetical protein